MRIKLDENMPRAVAELPRTAWHDTTTVPEEQLSSNRDPSLLRTATSEGRVLMTFDTDFADIRDYPPGTHAGIVVFRLHDQRWAMLKEPARRLVESGVLERRGLTMVDEIRVRMRMGPAEG